MTLEAFKSSITGGIDSKIIAPFVEQRMVNLRLELGINSNRIIQVENLRDVTNYPPFKENNINNEKPTVLLDWHGACSHTWNVNAKNDLKSMRGIRDIARKSDKIIISTSGINVKNEKGILWGMAKSAFGRNKMPSWPFFKGDRLASFIKRSNSKCVVEFVTGLDKVFNPKDRVDKLLLPVLRNGKELVIIGSSFTDMEMVKNLVGIAKKTDVKVGNLFYFNIGSHLVL